MITQPDHQMGYSRKAIESLFQGDQLARFDRWMSGQTAALDEATGQPVYFPWDVNRFLRGLPVID
jgi:hypothetical protein